MKSYLLKIFFLLFLQLLIFFGPIQAELCTWKYIDPCFVSITITASANPVCAGTSVTFTSSITNGGTSPIYQWYVNDIGVGTEPTYTYTPEDGNTITCQLTSNAPCSGSPAMSNQIIMAVYPNLPVSISISSSANPVCQGTEVIYTATPTNGGTDPSFQWSVNAVSAGTDSDTFSYTPLNGDIISCSLISNETCTTNNPATSNTIIMTVSPTQQVGVSIAASSNPACQGSLVTFTATPSNGGSSPIYQWNVNGVPVGTNSSEYIYSPSNGDIVTCQMTSNATCTTGNPAVSNVITMVVNQNVIVSVSINASVNPICSGLPVTFTATPFNGGMAPLFQWFVNGFPVGTNSPAYTYTPANGDIVRCQLTSNLPCTIGNPALSNQATMVVNPNLPVSVSITSSSNPVCEGTGVTFTAIPNNGGTSPVYEWKVNGIIVGTNSATYSYTPVNGDAVTCKLTSSEICEIGNPAISNTIVMIVSPYQPVGILISASGNPVCQGSSVTFSAIPTNGGTNPSYQWKVNDINVGANSPSYTYVPVNADVISCVLTSNVTCPTGNPAISNLINMTVVANSPVSVNITASSNPACQGLIVSYTAAGINGGTNPAYQWLVNGINVGTNNPAYNYVPANGDLINCQMTSNLTCTSGNPAISNQINMALISFVSVSVSITSSANPSCQGLPVTFSSTIVNGGSSPNYQWKVNGVNSGTNQPTFTYVPVNGETVTCQVTSSLSCTLMNPVTSNAITMSVLPILPASVVIATSSNPVCLGQQVTITATPTNGGSAPVYQWKLNGVNAGSNNQTFIYTPTNGDIITCQMTSSLICVSGNPAQSNQIVMVVSTSLEAGVHISASANPFCQGNLVTFIATPVNGGTSPSFQWKVNGINVGTNNITYIYTPVDGDFVTCRMLSNLSCATLNPATSNPILMRINTEHPVSITISPSENPVCPGSSVIFTAIPINGGPGPVYQWKVNGISVGTNLPTYTYIPVNGDIVTCQLISNEPCCSNNPATSNQIIMGVSPSLPASIFIWTMTNPSCPGEQVTFSSAITLGGLSPVYQWKVNGINAGTNSSTYSYTPLNGDIITCQLTSNATCINGPNPVISNAIIMNVSPALPVSVTIMASENPACEGSSVIFTATPTNGGNSPVYQWKVNGINAGTNDSIFIYLPVNGDAITCQMTSSLSCATGNPAPSNSITMTMTVKLPVGVTVSASVNPVCQGLPVTFTATTTNGGSSPEFKWRVNGLVCGTNSSTYNYIPVNADAVTCQVTSNANCLSGNPAISNQIHVVVNPLLPVSVSISASTNPFCQGTNVTFTAIPSNGGSSPFYQWKVNGVNVGSNLNTYSYFPINGDIVTCLLTSNETCVSNNPALSNSIVLTETAVLPVSVSITALLNPICAGSLIQYTATPTNGGTSPVYQWKVNDVNVGTNNHIYQYYPLDGDVVTCQLLSSLSCASGNPATSNAITMVAYPVLPVSVTITASSNPTCQGSMVNFTAIPTNGGNAPIYQWKVNGTIAGTNNPSFSYIPINNDVITCRLTSNVTCFTGNPATSNPITMAVEPYLTVGISIVASSNPVCSGTPVTFTAIPVNGGTSPVYQWKINGTNAGGNSSTFIYTPIDGDTVTCHLTSNANCILTDTAISNNIVMTVAPNQPVGITISASSNPVCQGGTVTFTAIPTNGGTSPTYQWTVNGSNVGSNSQAYAYIPNDGDIVICQLNSNATCTLNNPAVSNTITMSVGQNLPVGIIIEASSSQVCQGQTVTFTALPVNEGPNPIFQWMVNGMNAGTNSPTYIYIPSNGDLVTCQLFSNVFCPTGNPALSNQVIITVNPNISVSISITGSSNPVCEGSSVTYTAIPVNGGITPLFEWNVNGLIVGTNQSDYTYIPLNGDIVTCRLTSSLTCPTPQQAISNSITMTVLPYLAAGVSIVASNNPVCTGSIVSFTAIPVNGGTSPVYQWKVNGMIVGTNLSTFDYIPANGDLITCTLISNATCVIGNPCLSNEIVMIVSTDLLVGVTITASSNPTCQGQTVIYTATPYNGGPNPIYNWFVNDFSVGTNSQTYNYSPTNGDIVTCQLTSDFSCATGNPAVSNQISMIVNPNLPVSVNITASSNPACTGTSVTFTAVPVNGGPSPAFQWKVNGVNAGMNQPVFSYIPVNGDTVTCLITSNASCILNNTALSNQIIMVLSTDLSVTVSITSSENNICQGTAVTFIAVPTNGGSDPVYQWQVNGTDVGTNNPTYIYSPVNGDIIVCILTSNLTCVTGNPASSNAVNMTVNPLLPVSIVINSNPSDVICEGTVVTYSAFPTNGGTSPTYQWYRNGINVGTNSPTLILSPANGDIITCLLTSNASCPAGSPAMSNSITMTVNPLLPVNIVIAASASQVCEGTSVTFTSSVTNGGPSPFYQWKVNDINVGINAPSFDYIPIDGDLVHCVLTSNITCPAGSPASSNVITTQVNPLPQVSLTICSPVVTRDAQPFILKDGLPLGGSFSGQAVQGNLFNPALVPVGQSTSIVNYSYTNVNNCTASASQAVTVFPANSGFLCGQPLTDVRDNQIYATQQIGTQCWMSQNLNYGIYILSQTYQYDNCIPEKFCYSDLASSCTQYGGLYQWDELIQYETTEGAQGLCLPGWHIPTESEWNVLFSHLNGNGNAGDSLKAGGTTGFNALLAGVRYLNIEWSFGNMTTFFWTSTLDSQLHAIAHGMHMENNSVSLYNSSRANAFSVRCLKD